MSFEGATPPTQSRDAASQAVTGVFQPPATAAQASATENGHAHVRPTATGASYGFSVLRHKHYRNVWFGQFGSSMGGWMEHVGVAWIVNTTTKNPALALGYLAFAQLSPMVVLGLPGGLLADRVNRKKLLLITQFLMMLVAAALAVVSYTKPSSAALLLIILIALNGVAMAFNAPAWQVLTPRLVPREELTNAIFLNGLQFNLARLVGPALGGLILSAWGTTPLFVINTLSFVGVLLAVWSTPDTPTPPAARISLWSQTREALTFVWGNSGPRAVFMAILVFGLFAAPIMRLMPNFITEVFTETISASKKHQEIAYGALLSFMGIGAVAGVLAMRWVPKWYPKHHFIPISLLGGGVSITMFAASSSIVLGGLSILIAGFFWLWSFNAAFAAMQLLVPDAMRGRVMSVVNVAAFGTMALGPLGAGALGGAVTTLGEMATGAAVASGVGLQVSVGITGILLTGAALVMLTYRTPEVDGLKPGDPGYDREPSLLRGFTASAHRPSIMANDLAPARPRDTH